MNVTQQVGFLEAFILFWTNYFNFKGRSRRSEYWWVALWHLIITFTLLILGVLTLFILPVVGVVLLFALALYVLATIIPNLALNVRRFHDRGFSMLIPILSFVVGILYNIINAFTKRTEVTEFGHSTITNHTGFIPWPVLIIFLILLLGLNIFVFVVSLLDSQEETNKYGPSPKYVPYSGAYRQMHNEGVSNERSMTQQTQEPLHPNDDTSSQKKDNFMKE